MFMLKRHYRLGVLMILVLLGIMVLPTSGEVVNDGSKVGQWKTWVLTSSTESRCQHRRPSPPTRPKPS
jgi:hypothetical protein